MPKHKFSFRLSKVPPNDRKYFDLFAFTTTGDGTMVLSPIPSMLGSAGLHMSIHPSGVRHIRTTNPKLSSDIKGLEETFTNKELMTSFLDMLTPAPKPGYEALILVSDYPKRLVGGALPKRIVFDFTNFLAFSTIFCVDDTVHLAQALSQLRESGVIQDDNLTMIFIPELRQMSIYKPTSISEREAGTSSTGLRTAARYRGFFSMFGEESIAESEPIWSHPLLRPISEPMREIMESLPQSTFENSSMLASRSLAEELKGHTLKFNTLLDNARKLDLELK